MKATYQSDRDGGSLINLVFNTDKQSDKDKAENTGQWLVDNLGFDWITEEDDMLTVGCTGMTIKELTDCYKEAKEALSSATVSHINENQRQEGETVTEESKQFEGVFRFMLKCDTKRYRVYLVTAKNNVKDAYHYDVNISIENGAIYEIEDYIHNKTVYKDFSKEVVSYIEAILSLS